MNPKFRARFEAALKTTHQQMSKLYGVSIADDFRNGAKEIAESVYPIAKAEGRMEMMDDIMTLIARLAPVEAGKWGAIDAIGLIGRAFPDDVKRLRT